MIFTELQKEKYWPISASIFVTILFCFVFNSSANMSAFNKLADLSMSLSGTLVGFFLTILTVISTISTRRMMFVRDSGKYPTLQKYLKHVIVSHFVVITMLLVRPFVIFPQQNYLIIDGYNIALLFTVTFSWSLSIRFTKIFLDLLKE